MGMFVHGECARCWEEDCCCAPDQQDKCAFCGAAVPGIGYRDICAACNTTEAQDRRGSETTSARRSSAECPGYRPCESSLSTVSFMFQRLYGR